MKKLLCCLSASVPAFALLAEDTPVTTPSQVMTSISTTLQGYLTDAFPIIATIIGAGIGIWAVYKLVGLVKKGLTSGTGR